MAPNDPHDGMLEFLRRGEVRTMAKDIAVLRKEEAKTERERIAQLKTEQAQTPAALSLAPAVPAPPSAKEPGVAVPLPQKPAGRTKIIARGFALLFVAGALALAGFFAYQKFTATQAPGNPAPAKPAAPAPAPVLKIPAPVFFMQNTKTFEIQKEEDMGPLLLSFLQNNALQGFTHIVFENTAEQKVYSAKDFFAGMRMAWPQNLSNGMEDTITLFAYSSPSENSGQTKNRPGFVATFAQNNGTYGLLKAMEPSLETDFSSFAQILGQKDNSYAAFFRSIVYKKVLIRCQTFSAQDLGLCYTLVDTHYVFASSLESMKAVIDQLKTL